MVVIAVSGTPCTGKSTLSKALSEAFGWEYININRLMQASGIPIKKDTMRACKTVDLGDLDSFVRFRLARCNNAVIDSHMSHLLNKRLVDLCIILGCDLALLKSRLEKRGYSPLKVKENLDSEIFQVCLTEAQRRGHDILYIRTDRAETSSLIRKIRRTLLSRNVPVREDKRTCP